VTADDFHRTTDVNLRGVFLSYKYAAIQMIKQGRGGRIIGMEYMEDILQFELKFFTGASSVVGKRGAENSSSYAASKFGVRGLTQSAGKPYCIERMESDLSHFYLNSIGVGMSWYNRKCLLSRRNMDTHVYVINQIKC
jgi:hypothetical protein